MKKLIVSTSPHIHTNETTQSIMRDVLIALAPASVAAVVLFGLKALLTIVLCVGTCMLSEFLFNIITKKTQTVMDLSSAVTGLLLALNLSTKANVWHCIVGSVFAIVVVKCLFGGIGCNFANPAATGRVFLLVCFAGTLSGGAIPKFSSAPELVSGATPLELLANHGEMPSFFDMFLGMRPGAIGETCTAAIIIGFIYLVIRRVIHFETPVIFVGTVFVLSLIFEIDPTFAVYQVLSGGLVFGAVFMATDYVTTPLSRSGKMLFAFGCGVITFFIRYFGSYPEGVSFAILFMNILSPYIESWTKHFPVGGKTK